MRKTSKYAAAALLSATMAGCSLFAPKTTPTINPTTNEVETETPEETEAAINAVLYGEWTVADVGGTAVTGDDRPYVIFDTTAVNPFQLKIYANNGCNTINGELAVTPGGDMQKASEFLSTMMFCADAPYELGINMAFETVRSFSIEKIGQDYLLYMKDYSGKTLLTLRKSDISFLNGAWTVTKIHADAVPDSAGIKMVIDIPELRVHGNTGCNILNGSLFLDPDKQNAIQFVDLATTRMACPDGEREQQFLVALEEVETVIPADDGKGAILKNAQGTEVLHLRRLKLK